jgi:hypothetical protein
MMAPRIARVERLLSHRPEMIEPSPEATRRVIEALAAHRARAAGPARPFWTGAVAAGVGLAGVLGVLAWNQDRETGAGGTLGKRAGSGSAVRWEAEELRLDPAPALRPVARFVASAIEDPMAEQLESLLADTRRAADLVVGCLPFGGRGG